MKTPIHLWIVGVASLVWNAGGAFDYVMTQTGNEAYLSELTADQRAYMEAVPLWFEATWAVGVWFAVIGSLLILLRSRWAAAAFLLSLGGLVASSVYSFGLSDPSASDIMGSFAMVFSAVIGVLLVALWVYARGMTKQKVLR